MQRTLDWTRREDPRSLSYRVPVLDGEPERHLWKRRAWFDQGAEGACVGFGSIHAMSMAPFRQSDVTQQLAFETYREAQRLDQWAGEAYDGSSVLGGMQALKAMGRIKSYLWAHTAREVAIAVGHYGPVVLGVDWYEGMIDSDETGYLRAQGSVQGGHCVAVGGYDPVKGFRIDNSWGKEWSVNGSAWLTFSDMELLLANGEAALPQKPRRR